MLPLLILHGWGSFEKKWDKVKEILTQQGIKVFVPTLPGFGENLAPKEPWSVDDYVEWVKNFSQNFDPFFLLGHSFGGRIAIKFALKYPEKVSKLILVSSAGIKESKSQLQKFILTSGLKVFNLIFRLPVLDKFKPLFQKIFYRYILKKSDYLEAKGTMKGTFKKIIEEDLAPYLSEIKTPTLIIWGEKDKITPLKNAYLLKENIRNSELKILENVSHSPHLEAPEKLAKVILNFLKN